VRVSAGHHKQFPKPKGKLYRPLPLAAKLGAFIPIDFKAFVHPKKSKIYGWGATVDRFVTDDIDKVIDRFDDGVSRLSNLVLAFAMHIGGG
jgi:hypothetical protein